jgi:hypothetical protein
MVLHMNDEAAWRGATLPQIVTALFEILEPLSVPIRAKALRSVLAMLDDEGIDISQSLSPLMELSNPKGPNDGSSGFAAGKRVSAWLRKHKISDEELEQMFSNDSGKIAVFAVPGTKKREQTINAYVLTAVQAFLSTDEPKFKDSDAVTLCKRMGCFDQANHAQTRTTFGNRFSGDKDAGYILTAPGLEQAAALIKGKASE